MQETKLRKWKLPFQILKEQTRVCHLCFKEFKPRSLLYYVGENRYCYSCLKEINPKFIRFKASGVNALSIYDYDDKIKSLLYQFKGCFDIELYDIFLSRYKYELKLMYDGFVMVPIPSYREDDERRGFNHVEEMFKIIKLPMLKLLEKTEKVKQADLSFEERKEIKKYLKLVNNDSLQKRKILIVDDVYTTGSTVEAAINLIKQLHPKKIEVLVMSKAIYHPINEE